MEKPILKRLNIVPLGIILIVVLVIVVSIIGYFVFPQKSEAPGVKNAANFNSSVAVNTNSTIDTSDWQAYKNDLYEFSLKYPVGWPEPTSQTGNFYSGSAFPGANEKSWRLNLGAITLNACEGDNCYDYYLDVFTAVDFSETKRLLQSSGLVNNISEGISNGLNVLSYDEGGICGYKKIAVFGEKNTFLFTARCGADNEDLAIALDSIFSTFNLKSADDIGDWQTYNNYGYEYSFKYPTQYSIRDLSEANKASQNNLLSFIGIGSQLPESDLIFSVTVRFGSFQNNLDNLISSKKILENNISDFSVEGYHGKKLVKPASQLSQGDYFYILSVGDFSYEITVPIPVETASAAPNIISTFKFSAVIETNDWKTYTNVEDGYSIKYPADWKVTLINDYKNRFYCEASMPDCLWDLSVGTTNLTLSQFISDYDNSDTSASGLQLSKITKQEKFVLDGVEGTKLTAANAENSPGYFIYISHNGINYVLTVNDLPMRKKVGEKILSTFKLSK